MKRLILCADNRSPYLGTDDYWSHCIYMTESYAKRWNIEFRFILLEQPIGNRHVAWSRIPILRDLVNEYDEIMWFDSDATIINAEVDIFDYIKTAPESSLWVRDASVQEHPVLYTLVDKPTKPYSACSGIFLLDCRDKESAKRIMQDWWDDIPDMKYEKEHPWDQIVWSDVWRTDPAKRSRVRVADVWSLQEFEKQQVFIHISHMFGLVRLYEAKKYAYQYKTEFKNSTRRIAIYNDGNDVYSNHQYQYSICLKIALESAGYKVDLVRADFDRVDGYISFFYKHHAIVDVSEYSLVVFATLPENSAFVKRVKDARVPSVLLYTNSFSQSCIDSCIYGTKPDASVLATQLCKDVGGVWMEDSCDDSASLLRVALGNKVPVRVVPQFFVPLFLHMNRIYPSYTYSNGPKLNLVIMDSNKDGSHCGWKALNIAEALYLDVPHVIDTVYYLNMPDTAFARDTISSMAIWKDKKMRKFTQLRSADIMHYFSNPVKMNSNPVVFLSSQTHPSTHSYFELLYCGFPLLHTSGVLHAHDVGFLYTSMDSACAILKRFLSTNTHSAFEDYTRNAKRYVDSYSPYTHPILLHDG